MTGEETGLHAFDDLDPISTVSALSALPEEGLAPPPMTRTTPPEGRLKTPARTKTLGGLPLPRSAGTLPLPAPRGVLPPPRAASNPPPPPISAPAARELDNSGVTELSDEDAESDEDTRIVPNAFANDPDFAPTAAFARPGGDDGTLEAFDDTSGRAGAPAQPHAHTAGAPAAIDDAELLELSATTVATNIDMDWDEEEVETKLRDEGQAYEVTPPAPLALPQIGGRPSPFPAPPAGSYAGNPSPFAVRSSSLAPSNNQDTWEDEDEARTKIMNSPSSLTDELDVGTKSGQPKWLETATTLVGAARANPNFWPVAGFIAVALLALIIVTRLTSREPSTITLVTKPADAEVLIDGVALKGQTSPFTAQGIKPGDDHVLEVRHEGYATFTKHFGLKAGEVKALDTIELGAQRVDTGFALASLPAGATVSIDGRKLDQVTPVRINDLASGLHVVRLEYGSAYQPWETQVALATGQVIELPTARLVPAAPSAPVSTGSGEQVAATQTHSVSSDSAPHHHHSEHVSSSVAPARMMARPSAPMAAAPMSAGNFGFGAPAGGGGAQGALRINSRPWSQVFVDGRMVGNTPQMSIALPQGHHNVKLVNPQLGMSKAFPIDIKAGKVATKIVELE